MTFLCCGKSALQIEATLRSNRCSLYRHKTESEYNKKGKGEQYKVKAGHSWRCICLYLVLLVFVKGERFLATGFTGSVHHPGSVSEAKRDFHWIMNYEMSHPGKTSHLLMSC